MEPLIVTLALTGMELETVDPELGDEILTTRVPKPWARAGGDEIPTQQAITDNAAPQVSFMCDSHRIVTRGQRHADFYRLTALLIDNVSSRGCRKVVTSAG
jgi:hypothetical protein